MEWAIALAKALYCQMLEKMGMGDQRTDRICKKKNTVYYKNNCSNLKNTFHQKSDYKQHYKTCIGMNLESPHTRSENLKYKHIKHNLQNQVNVFSYTSTEQHRDIHC